MTMDLRAAGRTLATYRGTSLATQAYVAGRLVVAPLGPLAEEVAGHTGRLLSLGCGHGVVERFLAEANPDLTILGIDLDPGKVELIRSTAHRSPRVSLRQGDANELDEGSDWDVVLLCDLLHHLRPGDHGALARRVEKSLRPGGVCLVKDLDTRPRWKHEWNRWHDRLVAGPEPIHCRPPADMATLLADAGLEVERADRIDRLGPYAHYLVRARKPG